MCSSQHGGREAVGVFESPVKVVAIGDGREVGFQGGFLKRFLGFLKRRKNQQPCGVRKPHLNIAPNLTLTLTLN